MKNFIKKHSLWSDIDWINLKTGSMGLQGFGIWGMTKFKEKRHQIKWLAIMAPSIEEILSSPVVRNTIENEFRGKPFHLIERPGSFILALEKEPAGRITRLIVLKPKGFTANSFGELSSHPEAREATVEIKGAMRTGKKGYNLVKNCVEFIYYPTKLAETIAAYPYARADNALRLVKSSRTRFKVVRPDGYGFYHNLRNLTGEWLLLVLDKKLDLTKEIDYGLLDACNDEEKHTLLEFFMAARNLGDGIFKENPGLVETVISLQTEKSLPVLISFLNIPEGGRHEQCTVFAVILKTAKRNKGLARELLAKALSEDAAQPYYLNELLEKIS
jgi:hypothetical protein